MTEKPSTLNLFLDEIQKDNILGKPFTMKNATVFPFTKKNHSDPFPLEWWDLIKKIKLLRGNLGLQDFIHIAPFETGTTIIDAQTQCLIVDSEDYAKVKFKPLNSETIKQCFNEIKPDILAPIETEINFIIPVKRQVVINYYAFTTLQRRAKELLKSHNLPFYNFKMHFSEPIGFEIRKATPTQIIEEYQQVLLWSEKRDNFHRENASPEISTVKKPNQQPETEEEQHIKTLERAFHKEKPAAITKAVIFLTEKSGWTSRDFKTKFDVSDSTLSRYRSSKNTVAA